LSFFQGDGVEILGEFFWGERILKRETGDRQKPPDGLFKVFLSYKKAFTNFA
jgi:hypothetical protein